MPDVLGSFQRGYSLGSSIIDDMDRRDRQKTLQEREDTQWQQSQEDRTQRLSDAQTARERGETTWQQQQEDREQSLKDAEENRSRTKTLQGREDVQWKQSQDQYNHQQTLQRRQEAEALQNQWYNSMQLKGEFIPPPEQLMEYYKESPHMDLINSFAPDAYMSRQRVKTMMKQAQMGQLPKANDPVLVDSIENLFPEITNNTSLPTDYQGKPIQSRKISGVVPTEDGSGFMIQQTLTLDDGSTVNVPVTEGRTSDPNDNPMVVPFQEISKRMASLDQLDLSFSDEDKQQLFNIRAQYGLTQKGAKSNKDIEKAMLSALDNINIKESEALNNALDDSEREVIKQQYEQLRNRTRTAYESVLGTATKPTDRTRTDSKDFKLAMESVDNFAKDQGIKLTPEIRADVEDAYRRGMDLQQVLEGLVNEYGSGQSAEDADAVLAEILEGQGGSGGAPASEDSLVGTPTTTATGAQTTTGGRFYNVGNDIGVPGKVNPEQAAMTPYQARQPQTLSNYGYGRGQ